jgi:hypothetical protein
VYFLEAYYLYRQLPSVINYFAQSKLFGASIVPSTKVYRPSSVLPTREHAILLKNWSTGLFCFIFFVAKQTTRKVYHKTTYHFLDGCTEIAINLVEMCPGIDCEGNPGSLNSRDEGVRDPGIPGTLSGCDFPGIPGIRENLTDFGYGCRSTDTPTSSIVKISSDNCLCLHPTPPVSSVEEGIPVQTQSNDANAVPFPALPTHSNVCEETLHSLSYTS